MTGNFIGYIKNISGKKIDDTIISEQILLINEKLNLETEKNKKNILELSVKNLIESIQNKDYRKSFGLSRFIFLSNFNNPMIIIKKLGAFRPSKYEYNVKLLREIIFDIYKKNNFNDKDKTYIRNVIALSILSSDILVIKNRIKSFINSRPFFLKNALALAEIKFQDIDHLNITEDILIQDALYYNSRETYISSISYTLKLFKELGHSITGKDSIYVENCSIDAGYHEIFHDSYLIQLFNKSEIDVDFFEYNVDIVDNNKIVIYNHDFEHALRLGYTKTDLRWMSIKARLLNDKEFDKEKTFFGYMDNLCKDGFAEKYLYDIKEDPIERIVVAVLSMPTDHYEDMFQTNKLFFEEIAMLETLSQENYNSDFIEIKMFGNFTALDIIKIQRLFGFISFVYNYAYKQILNNKKSNAELIRKRSVLPVMKITELAKIFNHVTRHSIDDCLDIISKLSIDFSDKNDTIDLQYSPIIKAGDACMILPTVLYSSNLIRSFALESKINLSTFDNKDHMVKSIESVLINAGFHVKSDFIYGKNEIDILAFLDDTLFIFECKNPYHPVNSFELRNTYSHITKGFSQINKFKNILAEKESLKQLLLNSGIPNSNVKKIHYGVINANRALYGLTKNNITVYHANELINFIQTGEVTCMNEKYRTWETSHFTSNDLIRFINRDVIVSDFNEITDEIHYQYPLRNNTMILASNYFRLGDLPRHYINKYKKTDKSTT